MATIEQGAGTGVSFGLTDEQKALRELARGFAASRSGPVSTSATSTCVTPWRWSRRPTRSG